MFGTHLSMQTGQTLPEGKYVHRGRSRGGAKEREPGKIFFGCDVRVRVRDDHEFVLLREKQERDNTAFPTELCVGWRRERSAPYQ